MRVYVLYGMHMTDTAAGGYAPSYYYSGRMHAPTNPLNIRENALNTSMYALYTPTININQTACANKKITEKKKSKDTGPIFRNEVNLNEPKRTIIV